MKKIFYTIMANYNGSLEAQREIRYDRQQRSLRPSQVASSGHLRRCSDADASKQCLSRAKDASILSWPTIMGH